MTEFMVQSKSSDQVPRVRIWVIRIRQKNWIRTTPDQRQCTVCKSCRPKVIFWNSLLHDGSLSIWIRVEEEKNMSCSNGGSLHSTHSSYGCRQLPRSRSSWTGNAEQYRGYGTLIRYLYVRRMIWISNQCCGAGQRQSRNFLAENGQKRPTPAPALIFLFFKLLSKLLIFYNYIFRQQTQILNTAFGAIVLLTSCLKINNKFGMNLL